MLLNNLYTFTEPVKIAENKYELDIKLNGAHEIFKGHFPSQAILPGACLLEMLKDAVEVSTGSRRKIVTGSNIKYLKVVDPAVDVDMKMQIALRADSDVLNVTASTSLRDGSVNFRFKGQFA